MKYFNRVHKPVSLLMTALAYLAAYWAASAAVLSFNHLYGILTVSLLANLSATMLIFLFSMIYNNSSTYDPYWSLIPPVLFFHWIGQLDSLSDPRALIILGTALIWSLRLTSNWIRDWPGLSHEDWRYREFRERFRGSYPLVSLGAIHLFPTAIVSLACLPVFMALERGGNPLNIWDLAGLFFCLGGTALSYAADEQMRRFRHSNKGECLDKGLWSLCRHPNYTGEILFWIGLWFFALAVSRNLWWTGAGALAMYLMFHFVSVPWMEKKILKTRPAYSRIIRDIPPLIPSLFRGKKEILSSE
jgi:steroid 5-alpha reductase family enzyme